MVIIKYQRPYVNERKDLKKFILETSREKWKRRTLDQPKKRVNLSSRVHLSEFQEKQRMKWYRSVFSQPSGYQSGKPRRLGVVDRELQ